MAEEVEFEDLKTNPSFGNSVSADTRANDFYDSLAADDEDDVGSDSKSSQDQGGNDDSNESFEDDGISVEKKNLLDQIKDLDQKIEKGDFSKDTKARIQEVFRDEFLLASLGRAQKTTIQQTRSILTVFKKHIANDANLQNRLEKLFGKEEVENLKNFDDNDERLLEATRKRNIVLGGIELNNTSLFIEVSRYLFSPYIQFPELFQEDEDGNVKDPFRTTDVFNYANVVEIEQNTNDDIHRQLRRFIEDPKIDRLLKNDSALKGIYDKIKDDVYKMHTYFSIFLLLWNSPFDERDYGVQQYSKNVAMLSEKLGKFMDDLVKLDALYSEKEFKEKIERLISDHLKNVNRKFDEVAGMAIEGAENRINKRVDNFFEEMNKNITKFQKMKREMTILDDLSDSISKTVNNVESSIGAAYMSKISKNIEDLRSDVGRISGGGISEESVNTNAILEAIEKLNVRFTRLENDFRTFAKKGQGDLAQEVKFNDADLEEEFKRNLDNRPQRKEVSKQDLDIMQPSEKRGLFSKFTSLLSGDEKSQK